MAKLYFRYGTMGCGKTMQLLQVAYNYEKNHFKVCVAKPAIDTKKGTAVVTRIGPSRQTDLCFQPHDDLYNIIVDRFSDISCLLVDEAQFMTAKQVNQLLEIAVNLNITVITYGLRLNFQLTDEGFTGATRLLQIAHEIEELKTICECGNKALFNCRFVNNQITTEGPAVLIDGSEQNITYRALCPACYEKYQQRSATN